MYLLPWKSPASASRRGSLHFAFWVDLHHISTVIFNCSDVGRVSSWPARITDPLRSASYLAGRPVHNSGRAQVPIHSPTSKSTAEDTARRESWQRCTRCFSCLHSALLRQVRASLLNTCSPSDCNGAEAPCQSTACDSSARSDQANECLLNCHANPLDQVRRADARLTR